MSNPSKAKGTRFETAVCDYLRWALNDERIQRLTLHGARDIGDIGNVYWHGEPVVIECKATKSPGWNPHWRECETEMGNRDTSLGWVIRKRPRMGMDTRDKVGQHYAYTHVRVFNRMLQHSDDPVTTEIEQQIYFPHPHLAMISVRQLALILNHLQPLGPDDYKETHS